MFRVDFYVDDKRLGAALLALVGIAHGQPAVVPVVNAEKKGNGIVAKSSGSVLERFAHELQKLKGQPFRGADVTPCLKAVGVSSSSRNYMLKRAADAKLIKKHGTGSGMTYTVL